MTTNLPASSPPESLAADAPSITTVTGEVVPPSQDSEIKDPQIIFRNVWAKLEKKYGRDKMRFPKDIIWLMGAPGAGKTTNTPFICRARGITAAPVVMSELLTSHEAQKLKQEGKLVGDGLVVEILLERLLTPKIYQSGVVIDGFPRTEVQVECICLLQEKMQELRKEFYHSPHHFPRPAFRVCVLFVDQTESLARQRTRGIKNQIHNRQVLESGQGKFVEERATDVDEEKLIKRYVVFKQHYKTLLKLREHFNFSLIDARGTIREVERRILKEFQYQSSLELAEETYDVIQQIPIVDDLLRHTRQELVRRLDSYQASYPQLFAQVIEIIKKEVLPLLVRNAMSGSTVVRTRNLIFQNQTAIDMVIDVLSERGFNVTSDFKENRIPIAIDKDSMNIKWETQSVVEFGITFQKTTLRAQWDNDATNNTLPEEAEAS